MGLDGARIRQIREERGLSLRVLSAMVKDVTGVTVSAQGIWQAEEGTRPLSVEKSVALATTLGVGISDIVMQPAQVEA